MSILSELRERILEHGQESDLPFVSSYLGWAECWRGKLEAAATYCEESLECAARIGAAPMRYWSLAYAAVPPAYAGDRALTTARVEQCRELADQVGVDIALYWAGWARAVLALSEGDAETADAALAPFVPTFEEHGVPEPTGGFFLPDAIKTMISSRSARARGAVAHDVRGVGRPTVSRLGDHGRRPLPGATQER